MIASHTPLLRGLSIRGIPRYLEGNSSPWNPRIVVSFPQITMWVLKNKTFHFSRLTSVLVARSMSFNIYLKDFSSLTLGMPYSVVSSKNCLWVEAVSSMVCFKQWIIPWALVICITRPSSSIMSTKRKEETKSPCVRPLEGMKVLERLKSSSWMQDP